MNDQSAVSRVIARIGESRLAHMAKATVLLNAREMVDYWAPLRAPGTAKAKLSSTQM